MFRHRCLDSRLIWAGVLIPFLAAPALAQSWADGLFEETARDFGTVPKGPMLDHPFRVTNNTAQTVRISALRVSCGCTTATALQGTLAPGQSTVVLAQMDTRRFTGPKTVIIYVQFDQPESRETRLSVTATSLEQLSVTPRELSFGAVPKGKSGSAEVTVSVRGDFGWKITEATSASAFVEPIATEVMRTPSEVRYTIKATLKPGVPPGRWFTDVWLTTNAPGSPRINVPVALEVRAPLSLSPSVVQFGEVHQGAEAVRKVLVQAGRPFSIVSVSGADEGLSARIDKNPEAAVQGLTVTLKSTAAGPVRRTITVHTDLSEDAEIEVPVQAQIIP
jgi:hypothetical protein